MKSMTVKQVIEYLNNNETNSDFAFRGDNFVPVDSYNNSWYHGDEEDEFELDGVSAINIPDYSSESIVDAICKARFYGKNVVLLQGYQINAHEWANDPDECLIQDNKVVCIIDAEFIKPDVYWNPWKIRKE